MLNSCKNSVKILKIACIHAGTVANEGITKNALLDHFHTGCSGQGPSLRLRVEVPKEIP